MNYHRGKGGRWNGNNGKWPWSTQYGRYSHHKESWSNQNSREQNSHHRDHERYRYSNSRHYRSDYNNTYSNQVDQRYHNVSSSKSKNTNSSRDESKIRRSNSKDMLDQSEYTKEDTTQDQKNLKTPVTAKSDEQLVTSSNTAHSPVYVHVSSDEEKKSTKKQSSPETRTTLINNLVSDLMRRTPKQINDILTNPDQSKKYQAAFDALNKEKRIAKYNELHQKFPRQHPPPGNSTLINPADSVDLAQLPQHFVDSILGLDMAPTLPSTFSNEIDSEQIDDPCRDDFKLFPEMDCELLDEIDFRTTSETDLINTCDISLTDIPSSSPLEKIHQTCEKELSQQITKLSPIKTNTIQNTNVSVGISPNNNITRELKSSNLTLPSEINLEEIGMEQSEDFAKERKNDVSEPCSAQENRNSNVKNANSALQSTTTFLMPDSSQIHRNKNKYNRPCPRSKKKYPKDIDEYSSCALQFSPKEILKNTDLKNCENLNDSTINNITSITKNKSNSAEKDFTVTESFCNDRSVANNKITLSDDENTPLSIYLNSKNKKKKTKIEVLSDIRISPVTKSREDKISKSAISDIDKVENHDEIIAGDTILLKSQSQNNLDNINYINKSQSQNNLDNIHYTNESKSQKDLDNSDLDLNISISKNDLCYEHLTSEDNNINLSLCDSNNKINSHLPQEITLSTENDQTCLLDSKSTHFSINENLDEVDQSPDLSGKLSDTSAMNKSIIEVCDQTLSCDNINSNVSDYKNSESSTIKIVNVQSVSSNMPVCNDQTVNSNLMSESNFNILKEIFSIDKKILDMQMQRMKLIDEFLGNSKHVEDSNVTKSSYINNRDHVTLDNKSNTLTSLKINATSIVTDSIDNKTVNTVNDCIDNKIVNTVNDSIDNKSVNTEESEFTEKFPNTPIAVSLVISPTTKAQVQKKAKKKIDSVNVSKDIIIDDALEKKPIKEPKSKKHRTPTKKDKEKVKHNTTKRKSQSKKVDEIGKKIEKKKKEKTPKKSSKNIKKVTNKSSKDASVEKETSDAFGINSIASNISLNEFDHSKETEPTSKGQVDEKLVKEHSKIKNKSDKADKDKKGDKSTNRKRTHVDKNDKIDKKNRDKSPTKKRKKTSMDDKKNSISIDLTNSTQKSDKNKEHSIENKSQAHPMEVIDEIIQSDKVCDEIFSDSLSPKLATESGTIKKNIDDIENNNSNIENRSDNMKQKCESMDITENSILSEKTSNNTASSEIFHKKVIPIGLQTPKRVTKKIQKSFSQPSKIPLDSNITSPPEFIKNDPILKTNNSKKIKSPLKFPECSVVLRRLDMAFIQRSISSSSSLSDQDFSTNKNTSESETKDKDKDGFQEIKESETKSQNETDFDHSAEEASLVKESVRISFTDHKEPVVALCDHKAIVFAASEDGCVYAYDTGNGSLLYFMRRHYGAVTYVDVESDILYSVGLDARLQCCSIIDQKKDTSGERTLEFLANLSGPAQTFYISWGRIYIGTRTGILDVYDVSKKTLIDAFNVGNSSILCVVCTKEGPRQILLVATKEKTLSVRDAHSGLALREMYPPSASGMTPAIYCLSLQGHKVYCGTSGTNIEIFNYTSGEYIVSWSGGRGAVCLRESRGVLFSGCYDGNVYAHRLLTGALLGVLNGPGKLLLCICIVGDRIMAGTKDNALVLWKIPDDILKEMT